MACSLTMGGFIFYKDDGGEVQDKFMFFSCNIPKQTNLPKSRVNPNLATKEEPWRPVLLAADRGHHGVLDVLATHTEKGVGVSESCWRRSCMLCSWVQATTNWAVWSRDTEETVLHLVLKKSHKVICWFGLVSLVWFSAVANTQDTIGQGGVGWDRPGRWTTRSTVGFAR